MKTSGVHTDGTYRSLKWLKITDDEMAPEFVCPAFRDLTRSNMLLLIVG